MTREQMLALISEYGYARARTVNAKDAQECEDAIIELLKLEEKIENELKRLNF
jgi:hypothetical protein